MTRRDFTLLVFFAAMLLTSGCQSLFPSKTTRTDSRWHSFQEADLAFAKIIPGQTDTNGLMRLGFHPAVSPNVKILSYVDLLPIFMPNSSVSEDSLPAPVRDCIDAGQNGMAYAVDLQDLQSHRYGNLFLDIFGFKKKTHSSGWEFRGLILLTNNVVVYKLSSGEPFISSDEKELKPLGPLQQLDGVFFSIVGKVK